MKYLVLFSLYFLVGCATKYIVPGNRFITPETQGGAFHGQIELQQATANQLTVDTSNGNVIDGVIYEDVKRTGFLFSNSLFDQFDLLWSHTGGGNSMIGAKMQIVGASRVAKGAGQKLSIGLTFGANEHETDDESIEFELSGREILLLYGYRFNEAFLAFSSFSYATYNFEGTLHTSDSLNGMEPKYTTDSRSLSLGLEFSIESFFAKLEASCQQLSTTATNDKFGHRVGYAVGYSW
jgi:hypothetical protein